MPRDTRMDGPAPDRLWDLLRAATRRARDSGALVTSRTREDVVAADGFECLIRVLAGLGRKPPHAAPGLSAPNPFLPYEPAMFVAELGPRHVCLLNKFHIVDHHALIVTRAFEHQESLLTLADFEAWYACVEAFPSLAFYNGGRVAGASQPHKHMQVIPLPISAAHPQATLARFLAESSTRDDAPRRLDSLPYAHAFATLTHAGRESRPIGRAAWNAYEGMIDEFALKGSGSERAAAPYNLLATRDWILVVPRRAERFQGISMNALAFLGAFLAKDDSERRRIGDGGPIAVWREVAFPNDRYVPGVRVPGNP